MLSERRFFAFYSALSTQHSALMLEDLLQRVPVFAFVFFRLAGMMVFAPLFGSTRIPGG